MNDMDRERLVQVEDRAKSNTKRLDEHDSEIEELKKTYAIMEKMNYRMENVEKSVISIKSMTVQLIVYIVTTLFTYILGKVSKYFRWNETLPIPVQNIVIGIIATIIGCVIHVEGLDVNGVIQAVVTALGGVGTATVLYDAKNQ